MFEVQIHECSICRIKVDVPILTLYATRALVMMEF